MFSHGDLLIIYWKNKIIKLFSLGKTNNHLKLHLWFFFKALITFKTPEFAFFQANFVTLDVPFPTFMTKCKIPGNERLESNRWQLLKGRISPENKAGEIISSSALWIHTKHEDWGIILLRARLLSSSRCTTLCLRDISRSSLSESWTQNTAWLYQGSQESEKQEESQGQRWNQEFQPGNYKSFVPSLPGSAPKF